jgi:hypothetical protein
MHNGYVVKVEKLREHTNADRLNVATFFGNDVIVGKNIKIGDIGIYFPSDLQLGERFAKENNLNRENGGYLDDKKLNIKTIRLRGEKSDGIYVPIEALSYLTNIDAFEVGDTVGTIKGELICKKYFPVSRQRANTNTNKNKSKPKENLYPFFEQHKDTGQFAYNLNEFKLGDLLYVTLKMHGSSQRTSHALKKVKPNLIQRLLKIEPKQKYEYVTGTRRVVLEDFEGGYYGDNKFREPWHNFFVGKLPKGFSVFYEVVGFQKEGSPIMPRCNNKKMNDKNFIKKYGETTTFTYGCKDGESDIYVYRITFTNEDGVVVDLPWEQVKIYCEKWGVKHVPELSKFFYDGDSEWLREYIEDMSEGLDPIDMTHIKEGVVVRIENRDSFKAYKHKSFEFKVLESIIKDTSEKLDIEEQESLRGDDVE